MEGLYFVCCIIVSLGMLLWLRVFDVRKSSIQLINLLLIVISNLGFYFIAISSNVEEALAAQKIAYVGGIFLPLFYLFLVMEICHIELEKYISIILVSIQCVLYAFVCTIGKNELFYISANLYSKNGNKILEKVYGPVHSVYMLTMYVYLIAAIAVAIYTLRSKKAVNRRGVLAVVVFSTIAVAAYVIEKVIGIEYELIPIIFDVLMIGALIPVYDYNLFTVYENTDIINEQLGKVGFLTFDKNKIYKGCNNFMSNVFPELSEFQLGKKIENCSETLQLIIDQIAPLEELYNKNVKRKHVHTHLEPFSLNDRHYAGMLHIITNSFGKLKGYTIELRDDTEHYNALTLQESYSEALAKEVDEKTKFIKSIQERIILGMAQMVESRDLSTGGHIKRTSDVVRIFANKLMASDYGLDSQFLELVIRSAPMHDLGKIGVDDDILRKQGKFSDAEYEIMKRHSEIGYHMVGEILGGVEDPEFVRVAENVAHYHHEKVNGKGYPSGLVGDEIPVEARIMALADVFDALVSKRCYKEAFSYDRAFDIIKQDAGTHFDEKLAKIFLTCRKELEDYYDKDDE